MSRRVALPGADELFRNTDAVPRSKTPSADSPVEPGVRRGSGRVRHDEKITVYVSRDELIALETARLTLRGHGLAVDRGRIVREAIAMALESLDEQGEESDLVQRLSR